MHNTRGPGAEDDVEDRHPEEQDAREKCAKRNTKLKHYRPIAFERRQSGAAAALRADGRKLKRDGIPVSRR